MSVKENAVKRTLVWPWILVLAMMPALSATSTMAQDAVDLSYRVAEGHAYRFEDLSSSSLNMQINGGGQPIEAQQSTTGTMRGTARVLEVRDGLPSVVLLAFDEDLG